jgi:tetratricopeptide (TPR) repeat protein
MESFTEITLKDYLTLIVSFSALTVATISLFIKRPENRRTIRNQLTDALAKLMTVKVDREKLTLEEQHTYKGRDIHGLMGTYADQRQFLVEQAIFLADQIPDYISDIEYSFIARSLAEAGDHDRTVTYWQKSVEAAKSDRSRALAWRGLAQYYFLIGDFALGRQEYEKSISLARGTTDKLKIIRGDTYLRWASDELKLPAKREALSRYDNARIEFTSIALQKDKDFWLERLKKEEAKITN